MQRTIPLCCYLVVLIFRLLPDLSPLPHLYENLDSPPCMVLPHHFRPFFFLLLYATPPFLWSHDSDSSANDLSYLVLFFFFSLFVVHLGRMGIYFDDSPMTWNVAHFCSHFKILVHLGCAADPKCNCLTILCSHFSFTVVCSTKRNRSDYVPAAWVPQCVVL